MKQHADNVDRNADRQRQERHELQSYVWGLALALLLTVVPFALVYWVAIPRFSLLIVIAVCALGQMLVHFRYFLQVGLRQKRDALLLLVFSTLLLIIMVAGTIWIMASLSSRMV